MNKKILIVAGDPNSINSEIIFKSFKKLKKSEKNKIYVIGNYNLIKKQFKKLRYKLNLENIKNFSEKFNGSNLKIINVELNFKNPFKVKKSDASKYVTKSLNLAHKLAFDKTVSGIINCPIDKKLLSKQNIGVTEYLASKCNIKNDSEVMLIFNKKLSVTPLTTHINISNVSKKINIKKIINKSKIIDNWFKRKLHKKPKIGILGLNPHNSELKKNSEEKKIIIPAILKLKKNGIRAYGPIVSDSIFINDYKKYDVILGMYHDQVLAPFKALFKFNAINVTLGLKYLRISPDHGTAIDIINKNKASDESLSHCISFIKKYKR